MMKNHRRENHHEQRNHMDHIQITWVIHVTMGLSES